MSRGTPVGTREVVPLPHRRTSTHTTGIRIPFAVFAWEKDILKNPHTPDRPVPCVKLPDDLSLTDPSLRSRLYDSARYPPSNELERRRQRSRNFTLILSSIGTSFNVPT